MDTAWNSVCLPAALLDATVFTDGERDTIMCELSAHDDILTLLEQPVDGKNLRSINFDDRLPKLHVLHTAGSGDCLFNAYVQRGDRIPPVLRTIALPSISSVGTPCVHVLLCAYSHIPAYHFVYTAVTLRLTFMIVDPPPPVLCICCMHKYFLSCKHGFRLSTFPSHNITSSSQLSPPTNVCSLHSLFFQTLCGCVVQSLRRHMDSRACTNRPHVQHS
jgi:hypothetical protein